ncbi:MAG TPA: hypothetical protein VLA04_05355 [Verrucomicrobiae bacterium]|nr:hypothetical protein [Verrucomicrobiae bacterium]
MNEYWRKRINLAFSSPLGGDPDWDRDEMGPRVSDNPRFLQRLSDQAESESGSPLSDDDYQKIAANMMPTAG